MSRQIPTFTLPGGDPNIRDERGAYYYQQYRNAYKAAVGVYPEFDRIHNPTCAVLCQKVLCPEDLEEAKRASTKQGIMDIVTTGIRGGIAASESNNVPWRRPMTEFSEQVIPQTTGHLGSMMSGTVGELFPLFKKEYKAIFETYKYLYSAAVLAVEERDRIVNMDAGEHFVTPELGWRKREDGSYAEGTFDGEKFLYGMMYLPDFGFVVGELNHETLMMTGVWALEGCEWVMGTVNVTNLEYECDHMVRMIYEDGALFMQIGTFTHDRPDGYVLEFLVDAEGVIQMSDTKYDFGQPVQMTSAERSERKKLYGSSTGVRAVSYYRNIMFLIVSAVLAVMGLGNLGDPTGWMSLLVAVPFGLIGGFGLRSTLKKSQQAKKFDE